jgi:hypothetical protein
MTSRPLSSRAAVVGIVLVLVTAEALAHDTLRLETLTVPESRLMAGCRLSPSAFVRLDGNQMRGGLWAGLPITTNPWSGNDPSITVAIRERVAVSPRPPDGPPLSGRELTRFRLQLAADVEQAYAAVYADEGMQPIAVYAVRFNASPIPQSPAASGLPTGSLRLVRDRTAVVLAGNTGACSEAVGAYLAEFMAP